ncbi:toll-like receptor 4 [Littorina saxatilis]|uniref:TIR domain-containing protein n=1 Tax=Littorina saxatilis TaxID=31220 RepID=A0AAN9BX11_9CAEN
MLHTAVCVIAVVVTLKGGEPKKILPILPPFTRCGQCSCNGSTVDCSNQGWTTLHLSGLPESAASLSLRNNSISYLGPGVFASFISLRSLDLSSNVIVNISGDAFSSLKGLTELNLANNRITLMEGTSCAEKQFADLISLTNLDLSFNHLHNVSCSVAASFGTSLRWLALSHNGYFSNKNPRLLSSLNNLTFLDLSHNGMDTLNVEMFQDAILIQVLNLSHNQIPLNNESYPLDLFHQLGPSLVELRVEGNHNVSCHTENFSYPDQALQQLSHLRRLHMDGLPNAEFGPGFKGMTLLETLSLSGLEDSTCTINSLTNKTFQYFPHSLRSLNLTKCNISRIEMDVFRPLRHLHTLDLSFNLDLGFDTLGNAFYGLQGSDLQELHINNIIPPYAMCVMITPQNTRFFKETKLKVIRARGNRLEVFCKGALLNMPDSLKIVTLDKNNLGFGSYLKDLESLKNLQEIHNDGQAVAYEPPTEYPPDQLQHCSAGVVAEGAIPGLNCHRRWHTEDFPLTTWTPELTGESNLGPSSLQRLNKLVYTLPPKLLTYVSRWNKLYYKILEVQFNATNSLKILNLSKNILTTWIGPIYGLTKLSSLDLSSNFAYNVSKTFFEQLESLKVLIISDNKLRSVIEHDKDGELFAPLKKLQSLFLSRNDLNVVPENVFQGLVALQSLVLSHNEVFTFNVSISHMKNLSLLDLSFNYIHFLPKKITDHLDSVAEYRHVLLDLTYNPIACTCQHIDFLTWIDNSKVAFRFEEEMTCFMSDGGMHERTNVFAVIQSLQDTCTDKFGILVGAVSCAFCLLVAVLSALVYRYRWKLRYLYYASRLAYRRLQSCDDDNDDFEFDAFVSYSSEDNDFVHGELLEELETRAGLRLNVHNRDFIPGRPIPSNIVSAVQSSRRTLVVLSRELVQSEWCHYEMQMATMEAAHTGRDVLLFLLYEDVPSKQLPRDVLYNLQSSTYITFPGTRAEPSLVRDFWARLAQAVRQ